MLPNGLHKKRKATINRRLQQQEVVVVLATGLRESEKSNHLEVAVMTAARSSCSCYLTAYIKKEKQQSTGGGSSKRWWWCWPTAYERVKKSNHPEVAVMTAARSSCHAT